MDNLEIEQLRRVGPDCLPAVGIHFDDVNQMYSKEQLNYKCEDEVMNHDDSDDESSDTFDGGMWSDMVKAVAAPDAIVAPRRSTLTRGSNLTQRMSTNSWNVEDDDDSSIASDAIDDCEQVAELSSMFYEKNDLKHGMSYDDLKEIIRTEKRQESALQKNYLRSYGSGTTARRDDVVSKMIIEMVSQQLSHPTIHLAVNLFDTYLSKGGGLEPSMVTYGMAAVLLASKYEEITPIAASLLSRKAGVTMKQLLEAELSMLAAIDFRINNANEFLFLQYYLQELTIPRNEQAAAYYFCSVSVLCSQFQTFKPSVKAAAAIYLATRHMSPNPWSRVHQLATSYRASSLTAAARFLESELKRIESDPLPSHKIIKDIFATEYHSQISIHPDIIKSVHLR